MAVETTRADLRYQIAVLLNDVTLITATSNGTTTTFTDGQTLNDAMERPLNREIVFITANSNEGLVRRVTSFDPTTGTITFNAVTSAIQDGDVAHLFNYRTKGWKVNEINSAINMAMAEGGRTYKEPAFVLASAAYDTSDPVASPLTTMASIHGVSYLAPDGVTYLTIPRASSQNGIGWYPYGGGSGNEITILGGYWGAQVSGKTLAFMGYTEVAPLTADDDTTTMPADFIIYKAASLLCLNGRDRDPGNYNMGMLYREDARMRQPLSRRRGLNTALGVA